ncbi:hypothetical protein QIH93_20910 [Bradyrhizobium ottawaense]|uniref:hypothetical protein n=1 Tax=Bradyrhizobium ottawaense TaxID=931866 RepID=UPI0027146AFC|nr:hypothetical protein [Bradyrhizobium ottawaense]WLB43010.1 hypothetical protein QIH93_20910 [Bradyrhizobium ottawaense]
MTGKISEDPDKTVDGSEKVAAASGGVSYGILVSSIAAWLASTALTLTNKTINAANNTILGVVTSVAPGPGLCNGATLGPVTGAGTISVDGSFVNRNRIVNPSGQIAQFTPSGSSAVTISIASPGVVTWTGHTFPNGARLALITTGALPTGLAVGTVYYVVNQAANTFQLSATLGGAPINTSGTQSGTHTAYAAYADGDYDFDWWLSLTQSAPVTVSQLASPENGTASMLRTTQASATAQRFGKIQFIENLNCLDLRGQAVALSARVRMSASATLRFAILEWTGAANTVGASKDVVNNWASSTFTPGNFFLASNLAVTAIGSVALAANAFASIALTGTVGASASNIAVFFWTDAAQAQGVTLDIGKVQLEQGLAPTLFAQDSYAAELGKAQRYFLPIPVGCFFGGGTIRSGGTVFYAYMAIPVPMLALPVLTFVGMSVVVGDTLTAITSGAASAPCGNMLTLSMGTGSSAGSVGQALVFYNGANVNSLRVQF